MIVLDEPTAGIDIGSKSEIIALIRELASQGKAVIIISSELAELLAASDRIMVMSNGELVRDISREELDAVTAGAADAAERQQLAERQLQLALQHRAQQFTKLLGTGPNGETSGNRGQHPALRCGNRPDPGDERTRGDHPALRRQRLVERSAGGSARPARRHGRGDHRDQRSGFDASRQAADIEALLADQPDVIFALPVDPVATASAYRAVAALGVKLVFMENTPKGLVAGKDYVSVVSADNYGNGAASAELMANALGKEGAVGIISHAADFHVTRQRAEAFKQTMAKSFPKVRIVAEQGIAGPDFAADAERAASAMLASHPDLKGIWAVWDVPAEGVIAAAKAAGRDRSGRHHDRSRPQCRHRSGRGRRHQGRGRTARLRPGGHRGPARRLWFAGQAGSGVRCPTGLARRPGQRRRRLADCLPPAQPQPAAGSHVMSTAVTPSQDTTQGWQAMLLSAWRQNIIYLGFVVIFLVFAVTLHDKGFLDPNNLLNIVRQTAMIAIMAVAMTFVLSAGESICRSAPWRAWPRSRRRWPWTSAGRFSAWA